MENEESQSQAFLFPIKRFRADEVILSRTKRLDPLTADKNHPLIVINRPVRLREISRGMQEDTTHKFLTSKSYKNKTLLSLRFTLKLKAPPHKV